MTNYIDQVLIFLIYAASYNLLLGYAGQASIAHAAFGAVGGYCVAIFSVKAGVPLEASLAIGIVGGAGVGVLVGLPAMRLRALYLMLMTVAFQIVVVQIVQQVEFVGGIYGLPLEDTTIFGVDVTRSGEVILPFGILALIATVLCVYLGESPFGRVLRAIREDEPAARSLGKRTTRAKLATFALTSGLAGLAGGMLAIYNQLAAGGLYGFEQSMEIIAMVIVGGLANPIGSVLGAVAILGLQELLTHVFSISEHNSGLIRLIVYGAVLVIALQFRPEGLIPERTRRLAKRVMGGVRSTEAPLTSEASLAVSTPAGAMPVGAASLPSETGDSREIQLHSADGDQTPGRASVLEDDDHDRARDGSVLVVRGLTKSFGSIAAVKGTELELERGSITGLVGPNGAGKTTIFSLLTGFLKADAGSVCLNGRELIGMLPEEIARLGLVRSFQDVRVFQRMTALENVALGVQGHAGERIFGLVGTPRHVRRIEADVRETALQWLDFVGLAGSADEPAGARSFGEQQRIALARALATGAEVLLLDEPTAGIEARSLDGMLGLISQVREMGRTVCIVEHNLDVVKRLVDRAYFLELGTVVAQGTIHELMAESRLVESYFGAH